MLLAVSLPHAAAQTVAVAASTAVSAGKPAPDLKFSQLLQSPAGAKFDWPSLRGKVVVLEFWATWCAPCVAEIPVLNELAAKVDPAKVVIVSVDDEEPAVVVAFLKNHPIAGPIGIDTTSAVFDRYGVVARPATVVVGPDGKILSATVRPEQLQAATLMAAAEGKPVTLVSEPDAKAEAALHVAVAKAMAEQAVAENPGARSASGSTEGAKTLFDISLSKAPTASAGSDNAPRMTHIMMRGAGLIDISNATADVILAQISGMPGSRVKMADKMPETAYGLHLNAPGATPRQLTAAVELALTTGAGLKVEHKTAETDVYLLKVKATPASAAAKSRFENSAAPGKPGSGFAFYLARNGKLQAIHADADKLAAALEGALGKPVLNETGLAGELTTTFDLNPKDLAAVNQTLGSELGLELVAARRPVETVRISAGDSAEISPAAATGKPATEPDGVHLPGK